MRWESKLSYKDQFEMELASIHYGILKFTSKTRVRETGVPFIPFDSTLGIKQTEQNKHPQYQIIVNTRKSTSYTMDVWAKVSITGICGHGSEIASYSCPTTPVASLMEILGPVGEREIEAQMLMYHYKILPYKPPYTTSNILSSSNLLNADNIVNGMYVVNDDHSIMAVTVDGPYTVDMDDAISWSPSPSPSHSHLQSHSTLLDTKGIHSSGVLGIHITDMTQIINSYPGMFEWSNTRCSSAYPCGKNPIHMLPGKGSLGSLTTSNVAKRCISLFIEVGADYSLIKMTHDINASVVIDSNLTYDNFSQKCPDMYGILKKLSGCEDSTEQIAWTMTTYNKYFAELLSEQCQPNISPCMYRSKKDDESPALYSLTQKTHSSFNHAKYVHMTSPMRRFPDMYNQFVIKKLHIDMNPITEVDMDAINDRFTQIHRFHQADAVSSLALLLRDTPKFASFEIERPTEDYIRSVRLLIDGRKYRVPIHDSYYTEPICEQLKNAEYGHRHDVEVHGIVKGGRAQLRIRLSECTNANNFQDMKISQNISNVSNVCDVCDVCDVVLIKQDEQQKDHGLRSQSIKRMKDLLGYDLDAFQLQALDIIQEGNDLLGMAPTGSGKTVLALMAVLLRAFDQGKRAILTSPIKALSNQKFAEFCKWFGSDKVSLLTGDIQARALPPGGKSGPELLIMTSEILSEKLEQHRQGESELCDLDLFNVSVVVMDEVHYINDPDRGASWEKSMMLLHPDIQIVALSATLKDPERFANWMNSRRPTQIAQRFDRHVPLHIGSYNSSEKFIEFFSTHKEPRTISSYEYESIWKTNKVDTLLGCDKDKAQNNAIKSMVNNVTTSVKSVQNAKAKERNAVILAKILERDDKFPAIVFCMSRNKCMSHATDISERNLLLPSRPIKEKFQDEYDFAWKIEQHQEIVVDIRKKQDELYRRHLLKYRETLDQLPGYAEFKALIDHGIGYHHAGMLPLLREYVELLFQSRLLKIVFATETLGVGINMPARTVVFTQLDKPSGHGMRSLRPEEFWQMAGRSGRRGMDEQGFVVYFPLNNAIASSNEVRDIMLSSMPTVSSQLKVDKITVLKQLNRASDKTDLDKSLRSHENKRVVTELNKSLALIQTKDMNDTSRLDDYMQLYEKLHRQEGYFKLTPKQHKETSKKMKLIVEKLGGEGEVQKAILQVNETNLLKKEIVLLENDIEHQWNSELQWLINNDFVEMSEQLTIRGKVCAALVEGDPLRRGSMVYDGHMDDMEMNEIIVWLSGFTEPIIHSHNTVNDDDGYHHETAKIVQMWVENKDIREIVGVIGLDRLGVFVRVILRTLNFIDQTRTILLGLEGFEVFNRLEHAREHILSTIITNTSLYVSIRK